MKQVIELKHVWSPDQRAYNQVDEKFKKTSPFIKGPLPLEWILRAGTCGGKALHVGLIIWFLSGVTKSETVKLGSKLLESMNVTRASKASALRELVAANLITLKQLPGKAPEITLKRLNEKEIDSS